MLRVCWSVLGIVVAITSASLIVPHQTDEESLKSALDAVTRKQRSLTYIPQDYYNELRSFKHHPDDGPNDKFERSREQNQDLNEDDDDLAFLPLENGQLENIGGGFQNFNNKRLERALIDYLENSPGQRETVPSMFRERERSGGHKRGVINDRGVSNEGDKELATLFYKELQNGPSYNSADIDSQDYQLLDTLQSYYDRYRNDQNRLDRNKLYEKNSSPMSWSGMFGKQESLRDRDNQKNDDEDEVNDNDDDEEHELGDRERDQDSMYLLPAERRNVNGRYPLGRDYGVLWKRYPLTKRSPKPLPNEKQSPGFITDPKVAKDLGALFGTQTTETKNNKTHDNREKTQHTGAGLEHYDSHETLHASDHGNGEHVHDHDHDNEKGHVHHDHEHAKHGTSGAEHSVEAATSEASVSSIQSVSGQKEITNTNNKLSKLSSKGEQRQRTFEVKKKSVDWSQYFGIDRRKKKATLLARPGSQDQDDEWMLQRYYKAMAENLKSPGKSSFPEKNNGEKRDRLDQMDSRLKNVKNLIVEDALKYGSEDNSDAQEVKEIVMSRLAAAYSLEKMREALNEFRSNLAAQPRKKMFDSPSCMRSDLGKNNTIINYREELNGNVNGIDKKRNGHIIVDDENDCVGDTSFEGVDEGRNCPELEAIERKCRQVLINGLYEPCVMYHICNACNDKEVCSVIFEMEAAAVCQNMQDTRDFCNSRRLCVRTAFIISQMRPSPIATVLCHARADFCLRHSLYRYRSP